jgi:phage-related tail fiber protein
MTNTVRIKRRLTGATGAPASLENAELAFNEVDSTLYYGVGTGGAGGSATSIMAIAGPGAFVDKSTDQTIGGNKTFSNTPVVGTLTGTDNSTKAASTAFVKGQNYLTGNQNITVSGDATGSGATSIALTLANSGVTAGTYPKVTVDAKGRVTAGASLASTDIPTLTAAKISDFDTQVRTSRLDQMAAPTAAVGFNNQKASGLADPVSAQDAATKNYVDLAVQGLDPKASVKAASTANIASLSGTMTIDGIALVAGDRVLVKDQTTAAQNGIYVVSATAWARSDDMSVWAEFPDAYVFVEQGTTNADNGFLCTSDQGGTLGSTAVTWVQFSGAGQIVAGAGLTKTGNQLDIGTASSSRIVINADNIDLATTGVTASTYKSVTVDAYGRVTAGTNPTTLAGYGITDAQAKITATGLLKGAGAGSVSAAVAGTDYQAAISASGILKGDGLGGVTAAVAGTDYLSPSATIDGGTF